MTQPIPASQISAHAPARILRYVVVAAICLAGIGSSLFLRSLKTPPAHMIPDFMGFYMAAKLAGTPDLYNERAGWAVQDALIGRHAEGIPYIRLPFYATLLEPLRWLSYERAAKLWSGLLAVALIAFVWIFPLRRDVALCTICWSDGVHTNFFLGQDTMFLLVPIALCLRLYGGGQPYWAGLALSACLIKFHFLLFVPVLIVLQRTWRFAAGLSTGTLALLGMSFAVRGLAWPAEYLHALLRPSLQPSEPWMFNIRAAFLPFPQALQIHIAVSVLVAILVAVICRRTTFDLALSCCLLAALVVSLHVFGQDYVLTIPLLCLLFTRAPRTAIFLLLFSIFLYLSVFAVIIMAVFLLALVAIDAPGLSLSRGGRRALAPLPA